MRKVRSLPEADQRASRLPSGWTPLELLSHLAHMERRWFVWGFLGEDVDDPWGDDAERRPLARAPDVTVDDVVALLRDVGRPHVGRCWPAPAGRGAPAGPRFDDEPPTLAWICFHVLQEYARHAGHLDVAVELAGGDARRVSGGPQKPVTPSPP